MADATAPPTDAGVTTQPTPPPAEVTAPAAAPAPAPSVSAGGSVDPVALGKQYQAEFQATIEGLRQRSTGLQESIQAQIAAGPATFEPLKQELLMSVQDQSAVVTPPGKVFATFLWTTVMTFGASVGFFIGTNILSALISSVLGGFAVALLVLGALPYYAYKRLTGEAAANDVDQRMFLLAYSAGSGLLLGGAYGATYFYSEPLAFLTPLVVALVFAYGAPALGSARTSLLGASCGGAVAATLLIGILTGALSSSYFLLTVLYAGAAFVTLQFLFKNVQSDSAPSYIYMLGYVVAYFYAKALVFFVMGSSEPYAAESNQ